MTPEQILEVEGVIDAIGRHGEFAARFYERLFVVAPHTEPLFADVGAQQRKLTDELAAMVALLRDLPSLDDRARELGGRHRGYGVKAGDYRVAREVMVDTLREELGDEFGPAQEEAWTRATNLITELMLSS